ncbi:hypothetical protein JCM11251_003096 [Rhodosporidiobolus azoricus]
MSGSDSTTLVLARAASTVGLGLATGLMASIRVWSKVYKQGKKWMLTLIPICGSLLAYSALAAKPPLPYLPATYIGRHRKAILGTASVIFFSVGAFTGVAMEKLNYELMAIEEKLNKEVDASPSSSVYASQAAEADKTISTRWAKLHATRITLGSAAFLLSVAELAFA